MAIWALIATLMPDLSGMLNNYPPENLQWDERANIKKVHTQKCSQSSADKVLNSLVMSFSTV